MRKYILIILILTAGAKFSTGQNLVPNPSFENYTNCPNFASQINHVNNWYSIRETPDYLNICAPYGWASIPLNYFGNKMPASGNAYAGFGGFWQGSGSFPECVGAQLMTPLQIGTKYFLSFKVFLGQKANIYQWCGINKIGALFSTVHFDTINMAPLCNCSQIYTNSIITDTTNWTTITGSFVADSVYNYIGIGRFFDDASTSSTQITGTQCNAYYYLDDICLSNDSLFTAGWTWTTGINPLNDKTSFKLFPNPTNNKSTLQFDNAKKEICTLTLYDFYGKIVQSINNITSDQVVIEKKDLTNGLYYFVLQTINRVIVTGKLLVE
jgi:hypothetical protein